MHAVAPSLHTVDMTLPATLTAIATPTRIHPLQWAMAFSALLATAYAQLGQPTAYALFKPLPLLIALLCVAIATREQVRKPSFWLLMAGLLLSLLGDIFLLDMARFIPGLASFLLAHLCYIALFRRDAPWFAHRLGLALCLLAGALAYGYLNHHGLPPNVQWPVAVYVTVITLMTAQALGRAHSLRTPAARCVAWGALSFLLSDTVLAVNKFAWPVPNSPVWVMGSYYLAQWLIVHGMLQTLRLPAPKK